MTIVLNKKTLKKDFQEILKSLESKKNIKGINTLEFCGVIKLKKDALVIQKEMRNEWE